MYTVQRLSDYKFDTPPSEFCSYVTVMAALFGKGSNRVPPEVQSLPVTSANLVAKCAVLLLTKVVHIVTTELYGINLSRRILGVYSREV
jgi:hypothetical protein